MKLGAAARNQLRTAILSSLPPEPSQFDAVAPQFVYVPPSHMRALEPDAMLVEGIRGAGKSFWWHVLQNPLLSESLVGTVKVTAGFGVGTSAAWPEKDELIDLLRRGRRPRIIWKSIVLRHVAPKAGPIESWDQLVQWVESEPSLVATAMRDADAKLVSVQKRHVVVFDALDRTADTSDDRQLLLRGLLEVVLELRAMRALRAKVFVRPDMLADPQVKAFPDASKVVASRVKLDWSGIDLYGLLYNYLGNGSDPGAAKAFREMTGQRWKRDGDAWLLPQELRNDSAAQADIFVQLAGPWMGRNKRRGRTYTWIPNHLADAFGNVSPRSFLAAVRRAAEVAEPEQEHPLHWTGLQDGVRAASEYRVEEVAEDLPWAHAAMAMLADVVVPCKRDALLSAWKRGDLTRKLVTGRLREAEKSGLAEIVDELAMAGILAPLGDGRLNIPDVYRVGFGLRRKGGLAPG